MTRFGRWRQLGEYHRLVSELRRDNFRFKMYFRMSPTVFDQLLGAFFFVIISIVNTRHVIHNASSPNSFDKGFVLHYFMNWIFMTLSRATRSLAIGWSTRRRRCEWALIDHHLPNSRHWQQQYSDLVKVYFTLIKRTKVQCTIKSTAHGTTRSTQ